VVEVDRRLLARGGLAVAGAEGARAGWVAAVLDRHRIPDGFPFVVDDNGTMAGCRRLNGYLLDAAAGMRRSCASGCHTSSRAPSR
jgi:hypothetical protein